MAENNAYIAEIIKSEVGAMELEAALAESTRNGVRLLDALEASGHDKERLFEVVAESAGMKTVALTPEYPPAENARLLDAETARRYRVVPLRENLFAIGDPTDLETLDTLRYLFADPVEWVAAPPERIGAALDRLYPVTDAGMETLVGLMDDHREEGGAVPNEIDDAEEPVIKLVNLLIQEAHKARASDIHL